MIKLPDKTLFFAIAIFLFAVLIILFPKDSLNAAKSGLHMWWNVVFPSLLPFFIVSELLIGYGVVRFIGVLLEPFMRPVFRVPGVGGFVWAMGMASGFPAGAKLTARLRQEEQITAIEAERLVSFTNSSNPLFIFAAVSIGFFQNEQIGLVLAASHYLSNICVGLIMRFYGRKREKILERRKKITFPSLKQAFFSLHEQLTKEQKPFGKMLGDAVIQSIQTLLMIGGFIILFSVFNKMLDMIHFTSFLGKLISHLFELLNIPSSLGGPFISGLFEITLGSQLTSAADSNLLHKVIIVSFILAFSGFSVQAQVASILAETDIRFQPFFYARILQGILSASIAYFLFKPLYLERPFSSRPIIPVFNREEALNWMTSLWNVLLEAGPFVTILALTLYLVLYFQRTVTKND
ncbi:sporulation integral membrane protein YlbJ [Bacillus alveayuensis]|uniref:Sporulation integral membrane protein YlbJ n=1 Tax=Aeribacillus alveayuensis TaxID=279215 RepID=A0ABT9VKW4_9BACI|nr:sporulation integral membrane protein YlbJ [Bacillus alveayuensis]